MTCTARDLEPNFGDFESGALLMADARLMRVAERPQCIMVRGAGSYLWDHAGARYLDFVQGWAVNALGHAAPEISAALHEQAQTLITASPAFHNAPQLALAHELVSATGLASVYFGSSGAEANEGALKLARKWGRLERAGASEIITTDGAFHGRTLALMAASGKPGWDELFPPKMPGFVKVPFGDADAVAAHIGRKTAAVMVEPIQGEAGVVVPPDGYLLALRALCDEHNLLLICDEIQTGMGRTGTLFAFEREGVRPDILTLGKGLGGGVPISAVLANTRASCFVPGDQGGTFGGNPLMTAVARRVLSIVSNGEFLAYVRASGRRLEQRLAELCSKHGLGRRGRGLLWALVLPSDTAERVLRTCFTRGLLLNAPRPNLLRLMPSLRVSAEEIDEMASVLDRALDA
ncbi:MAG TPA: acetylornithine transaminase [Polyangiaceae bacterium]|jgi:acetylornithine/N-succinyldiaminopimelate aminotransferase|nr:acetylornithine transaminase [Polyangiaceae bacterium]